MIYLKNFEEICKHQFSILKEKGKTKDFLLVFSFTLKKNP